MQKKGIGIDIGGTKTLLVEMDTTGRILQEKILPTDATANPEKLFYRLLKEIDSWSDDHKTPIGIGIAGQVDSSTGTLLFGPNLQWANLPIQEWFYKNSAHPIAVINDVQAATYGEWLFEAGRGYTDLLVLFLGTGIGGGIVSGGHLLRGASGCAGEVGHMCMVDQGAPCNCGRKGCLEAYFGGSGLTNRIRFALEIHGVHSPFWEAYSDLNATLIAEAYHAQEPIALHYVEEGILILKNALLSLTHTLNPQRIILGGGLLQSFPKLPSQIEQYLHAHLLPALCPSLTVVPTKLRAAAGAMGAAGWALNPLNHLLPKTGE